MRKLEDLSIVEINAEIGLRMELIEQANFQLNSLRQRRSFLSDQEKLNSIKENGNVDVMKEDSNCTLNQ